MLGELLWKEKEGKALERKHLQYIIVFSKTTSQGPLLSQLLRNLNLDENALIASHWMLFDILVLFFTVVQLIEFWLVNTHFCENIYIFTSFVIVKLQIDMSKVKHSKARVVIGITK